MVWPSILLTFAVAAVAPAPQAPHDTVQGAVTVIDARARTIDVKSAVGMVVRVTRLRVLPETKFSAAGDSLDFALLLPGDIVRVSFGDRAGGAVAYTIERVGRLTPAPGGRP